MEGAHQLARLPRRSRPARTAPVLPWVRERLTTTPGRLMLISLLVVAGAVCLGVIATVAERSRAQAAHAVRADTEPLLVQAVTLYTAPSDANATASTTFLKGGLEPPARRPCSLHDLGVASDSLATLTRELSGSPEGRAAVATITAQLPVYSGLVEAARANNRQGLPIGAAYLRQASTLLSGTILAEAEHLYATEAQRLSDDYRRGTSATALVVIVLAVVIALAGLALTQLFLTRISRGILNVPMVLATVLLAGVAIWATVGCSASRARSPAPGASRIRSRSSRPRACCSRALRAIRA